MPELDPATVYYSYFGLLFEWNRQKAGINLAKHGVSFEEAASTFVSQSSMLIDDPEHSDLEERFILIGLSDQFRLIAVVHVEREGSLRIISSRKASLKEAGDYDARRRTGL